MKKICAKKISDRDFRSRSNFPALYLKTRVTESTGFHRTFDRFEDRTIIQRFNHTLSPAGLALDFATNGFETYFPYDHYQDTYEMVDVSTQIETTYAHYGNNGQFLGTSSALSLIPPAHSTPGTLVRTNYIGTSPQAIGTTLDCCG